MSFLSAVPPCAQAFGITGRSVAEPMRQRHVTFTRKISFPSLLTTPAWCTRMHTHTQAHTYTHTFMQMPSFLFITLTCNGLHITAKPLNSKSNKLASRQAAPLSASHLSLLLPLLLRLPPPRPFFCALSVEVAFLGGKCNELVRGHTL